MKALKISCFSDADSSSIFLGIYCRGGVLSQRHTDYTKVPYTVENWFLSDQHFSGIVI